MSAAGQHPLLVFFARAEALARLAISGALDPKTAIGDLVHDANKSGLVADVGRSVIDSIILAAFTKRETIH